MANIKFIGTWSPKYQSNVPKGYLVIKVHEDKYKKVGKALNKLHDLQTKKNELRELDIDIKYHYSKRTIDQNSLLWALYQIEANEQNAGMSGDKKQNITTEELYNNDLEEYAPRIQLNIDANLVNMVKSEYRIVEEKENPKDKNKKILTGIITSSKFTTVQMAQFIDRIFNRIAFSGVEVTKPEDIHEYWQRWKQTLNDKKIVLNNELMTGAEYKKRNPICEATGNFIGDNSGQLCHIKARGMGGNVEEEKDIPANWLHLCHEAHINIQHAKGWDHFLKLYPHLSNKVNAALNEGNLKENIINTFEGEIINE